MDASKGATVGLSLELASDAEGSLQATADRTCEACDPDRIVVNNACTDCPPGQGPDAARTGTTGASSDDDTPARRNRS